jgi:hypothetical protein
VDEIRVIKPLAFFSAYTVNIGQHKPINNEGGATPTMAVTPPNLPSFQDQKVAFSTGNTIFPQANVVNPKFDFMVKFNYVNSGPIRLAESLIKYRSERFSTVC